MIAKLNDAIYVLHAFQKKTQKAPKQDINLAKQRLKTLMQDLSHEKSESQ